MSKSNAMMYHTIPHLKISKIFPILNSAKDFPPIDITFNVKIKCYGVPENLNSIKDFLPIEMHSNVNIKCYGVHTYYYQKNF